MFCFVSGRNITRIHLNKQLKKGTQRDSRKSHRISAKTAEIGEIPVISVKKSADISGNHMSQSLTALVYLPVSALFLRQLSPFIIRIHLWDRH